MRLSKGGIDLLDVIKDYLVSLGFQVDSQSLGHAKHAMAEAEKFVARFAGSSTTQFAVAGTAVTTFVATASLALAKYMNDLAQTELRMQMFARQMYTTTDNATAFVNSLDAMGRSMEELYLSPELIQQFQQLRQQSFNMRPPEEYKEQMKAIRSITFEFTRLKLEATYAMQWIAFYVFKYLEGPIKQLKLSMSGINDSITKNMPKWTKTIAMVVSWVARLGLALYSVKEAVGLVAGAFLAFKVFNLASSPIGMMIIGLTTLLLLIDDYNTWKNGGDSLLGDTWKSLKDNGVFEALDEITKSAENLFKALGNVGGKLGELLLTLTGTKTFKEFADLLENRISKVLEGIANYIKSITDLLNGDFKKAMEDFKKANKDLFQNGNSIDYGKYGDTLKENAKSSFDFFTDPGKWWKDFKSQMTLSPSWITPQAYHKPQVTSNQTNTFNVYGTEPNATAFAVSNKLSGITTRSIQGNIA